ncbi:MoaD/ThiS family protein [Sphingomonas piscis]|uniref:MoaD/ThiS family protein n=1 Tax=Sphingomonas piscis TaxID=2714943 RepID=A0A6G7YRY4_9SPHN|nr:MoaD/ThiS family protein [Sphingomonas piscis]QIK79508.1 MoaD/ThiS family protein [Sphingomonas piscis]
MQVRFFGKFAAEIGEIIEVDVDPGTVADLKEALAQRFPASGADLRGARTLACVADAIVPDDYRLDGVEAVEILAPVSGG